MTPEPYQRFTLELLGRLQAEPDVLGLVALGSMSGQPPAADAWSDHDFFVVTGTGSQERFRGNKLWLPDADRIVLTYRETAHGVKALWDDGHLAEFAVFDLQELYLARVNRWTVLFDRGGVADRMSDVEKATTRQVATARPSDDWRCGQFLTALLVGDGRHRRGERLAGRRQLMTALEHFLALLATYVPAQAGATPDDLDPFRRVEVSYPVLAGELAAAVAADPPEAARALIALARRELAPRVNGWSDAGAEARTTGGESLKKARDAPREPAESGVRDSEPSFLVDQLGGDSPHPTSRWANQSGSPMNRVSTKSRVRRPRRSSKKRPAKRCRYAFRRAASVAPRARYSGASVMRSFFLP